MSVGPGRTVDRWRDPRAIRRAYGAYVITGTERDHQLRRVPTVPCRDVCLTWTGGIHLARDSETLAVMLARINDTRRREWETFRSSIGGRTRIGPLARDFWATVETS
jgi:hypothetical protein